MNGIYRQRAQALLEKMDLEEKIYQLTSDMIFNVDDDYETRRDPRYGSYRNPGHFMHHTRTAPASPEEVARRINRDVELSVASQPHGIPPIENGEALHGAQWGMCTNFPQPIGLASSFDPEMVGRVADAIGKECAAVGVRQVFSPVVNLARDCRWGRTVETYGEDVKLSSDMGAAMCRGLEKNGVIATPKHFADNYSYGGRDSNYSELSERTMRETILPPFKACFDAGAFSVMAAYNAWEGVPCTANHRLLTEILRDDWGFEGFVVSDYCGAEGVCEAHSMKDNVPEALAESLKAGLDVILPFGRHDELLEAVEKGFITEKELDKNVLRVLTAKFRLGLFDDPYPSPEEAQKLVRCAGHRSLALSAARSSVILLKNEGVLPLNKRQIKKIGVFGRSAELIPIGSNYSGPYGTPWQGEGAPTPLEALRDFCGGDIEVVYCDSSDIDTAAQSCDVNLYFTTILEGEGSDRSDLRLPSVDRRTRSSSDGGFIVDEAAEVVLEDQEDSIKRLCAAGKNTVIVLMNGSPIDMSAWIEDAPAVVEAWYPGEQGAVALAEILFGVTVPSAKLPVTIPKCVGQLPLNYSYKPSGRGYSYCDNDGRPLFPFGFGLSYTSFDIGKASLEVTGSAVSVGFDISNTGSVDGAEVVQLYVGSYNCGVVRPLKELKAYKRIFVKAGENVRNRLSLSAWDLCYWDRDMRFGLHDGCHRLMLGTSCEDIKAVFEISVKDGSIALKQ